MTRYLLIASAFVCAMAFAAPAQAGYEHEFLNPATVTPLELGTDTDSITCRVLADNVTNIRPIYIDCADFINGGGDIISGTFTFDDGTGASPSVVFKDETDETATFSKVDAGFLGLTTTAGDGLNILTGNLKVGNGTPDVTQDGEDAYVEGTLEVDGGAEFDGAVDFDSTITIGSTSMTSTGAELNYLDLATLGTGAASKAVVLDASGDYTYPATATIVVPSSGSYSFSSGSVFSVATQATLTGEVNLGAVSTFTDSDTTPDVSGAAYWNTNTTGVTITDFDGAGLSDGDIIVVVSKGAIVYDVTTSGIICGSTDITTAASDVTTFIYDGTDWRCTARLDHSDDLN